MEALIILADILCMLLLCLSLVRLARGKTRDLGVFSFKEDRSKATGKGAADVKEKSDA